MRKVLEITLLTLVTRNRLPSSPSEKMKSICFTSFCMSL